MLAFSEKIELYCQKHNLFDDVKRPLLAISGGVDSIVMLHYFMSRKVFDFFEVVYCDHGIRTDEEIVRDKEVILNIINIIHIINIINIIINQCC